MNTSPKLNPQDLQKEYSMDQSRRTIALDSKNLKNFLMKSSCFFFVPTPPSNPGAEKWIVPGWKKYSIVNPKDSLETVLGEVHETKWNPEDDT